MPASRQSRYKDRYDKLLGDSLAIVQSTNFSDDELSRAAEDAFKRVPGAVMVPIEKIEPNPDNPRHDMDGTSLRTLADSVAERGLLQPLVVRRNLDRLGQYLVIAGSRRLFAARLVRGDPDEEIRDRVAQIPCIIKEASDLDAFADALLENLARADLSRAEMMEALLRLQRDYGWSANYIARRTGRNQSDISQLLGVAHHPELSRLVREEVIKPTVAGEINRMPEPLRESTIAEVNAGKVRTVSDVKRRRAAAQIPETEAAGRTARPRGNADTRTSPSPEAPPKDDGDTLAPSDLGHLGAGVVISLPPSMDSVTDQLAAIGALAAMVDADTLAGGGVLVAVRRDLAAVYDRLAGYLKRQERRGD